MSTAPHQSRIGLAAESTYSPRVLHIIDLPGAGWDGLAAAARCAETLPADQRLLLIGDHAAAADASAFGLAPDYRLCPPLNRLNAAVGQFDRLLKGIAAVWPVDIVHVWSDSARVLCRETIGYSLPVTQEDPAPFTPALRPLERNAARAALGIADHETALLLAADRAGVGDARRFAGLVGVLHLAEFSAVGIASSRSDTGRRAARFLRGFRREWDVIPLKTPPHIAVPAADIVVYDQGDSLQADAGPGRLTGGIVVTAATMGIPVITTPSPLARRVLGPLAAQLMTSDGSLPELARLAVPLCTDHDLRSEVGQRLRGHVASTQVPALMDRWTAALKRGTAA